MGSEMTMATNFSNELSVGVSLHCVLAWFQKHIIFVLSTLSCIRAI